jgi:hypothetical protein
MSSNPFQRPDKEAGACRALCLYHLDRAACRYLGEAIRQGVTRSLSHVIFYVSPGVFGLQLLDTPWDETRPRYFREFTAAALRRAHREFGIPPSLVDLLHLAGEAGVRYLIFDADALEIDGLPVHDD